MPIIEMPDGNKVDLGDNPSPEMKDAVARKYKELEAAKSSAPATGTPTTTASATTTTPVSGQAPPEAGWGPTIARTAGPILGGIAGIPLGPPGVIEGTALGSAVGDITAQAMEKKAGVRKEYNPLRTVAEAGTNVAFAGLPMGDAMITAVAKAGTLGVVSSNAISLSEGQGINSPGQSAIAFLTAGGLQATGHYVSTRNQAVKEFSGVPQIEEHVDIMSKPNAPTHGPDGSPTEIPAPTLLDEFGRPAKRPTEYPIKEPGKAGQAPTVLQSSIADHKQAVMDTWMEQRRPGLFEAKPSNDVPPLEAVHEPLFEPDGGMADLQQQAKEPVHDIPGNGEFNDPSPLTSEVMRYIGRTKTYFQRLENETKYPVYQDYDSLSQANKKFQDLRSRLTDTAGKALKGSDREDWNSLLQDLYAGADGQSLKPKMRPKVEAISNVTDKALEPFGITSRDFWTELVPALNENNVDVYGSAKYGKLTDALNEGKINTQTTDLPRLMQQLTNMGAFETHAGDVVRGLQQKYSNELHPDIPKAVSDAINYFTKVLDGTPDKLAKGLGGAITHTASKFGWDINGSAIANRIVGSQYAAMMAGRPGPAIHNALQPIQTASGYMGFSWLAEGYRQMLTKEGRSIVDSSGVGADSMMNSLANIGQKTRVGRFVDASISYFMAPFTFAENVNRGSVYLGTRAKVLWAAEKYGDNVDKFLRKSGVGRYTQQEANIVLGHLNSGDAEAAADRAAQMMVDNTQFMYSQFERPRIMTGMGKSAGAFGMWPVQYGGLLTRMAERGANGTWYEVGRDYTRFLAANAALFGTFYSAGKYFNDDNSRIHNLGWLLVAPSVYTGSPMVGAIAAGAKLIQKGLSTQPLTKRDLSSAFRDVAAPFIPFSGLGMDVVKASKEPTAGEAVARAFGIKRGAEYKEKSKLGKIGETKKYGKL